MLIKLNTVWIRTHSVPPLNVTAWISASSEYGKFLERTSKNEVQTSTNEETIRGVYISSSFLVGRLPVQLSHYIVLLWVKYTKFFFVSFFQYFDAYFVIITIF